MADPKKIWEFCHLSPPLKKKNDTHFCIFPDEFFLDENNNSLEIKSFCCNIFKVFRRDPFFSRLVTQKWRIWRNFHAQ